MESLLKPKSCITQHTQAAASQSSFAEFSRLLPSKAFQHQELEMGKSQGQETEL